MEPVRKFSQIIRCRVLATMFGMLPGGMALAGGQQPVNPDVQRFITEVRVEVDGNGQIARAQIDDKLPGPVSDVVERTVRGYRFVSPTKGGIGVGGVTYVSMQGCLAPAGNDMTLALSYLGHGPRFIGPPAPIYPASQFDSDGAIFRVTYQVRADGAGEVESIEKLSPRGDMDFVRSIRRWIEGGHFDPELVAAQPVATRLRRTVEFIPPTARTPFAAKQERRTHDLSTDTCKRAMGESEKEVAIALDSPFTIAAGG